eukprot:9474794-Pyramimonas_sp.AAC.1
MPELRPPALPNWRSPLARRSSPPGWPAAWRGCPPGPAGPRAAPGCRQRPRCCPPGRPRR